MCDNKHRIIIVIVDLMSQCQFVDRRQKEEQDQQPPGLAAHRSCHSWEGRMGGWRVEGGVEREEVIQ